MDDRGLNYRGGRFQGFNTDGNARAHAGHNYNYNHNNYYYHNYFGYPGSNDPNYVTAQKSTHELEERRNSRMPDKAQNVSDRANVASPSQRSDTTSRENDDHRSEDRQYSRMPDRAQDIPDSARVDSPSQSSDTSTHKHDYSCVGRDSNESTMKLTELDLLSKDASALQKLLKEGKITSRSLIEQSLAQIRKHDNQLRAMISIVPEVILYENAGRRDEERRRGDLRGPFHRIPIIVEVIPTFRFI